MNDWLEDLIYETGSLLTVFWPPAYWRWQKEWKYRREFGHFKGCRR